ncbi:hypothetical protein ONS95_013581 [Cadophora gregata]|uniref:uncharacterized protein n=1 Tax=Cadophora gregata TaxID=51156 RepID=UPI0026DD5276|nr:uncharacterized protein ONS95_013581 [Cadophora gregata]KAK0113325.1 hypothetical protein ONS96_014190 [Cadophora gregata f. sp. sojae]KAK0114076.1 hypothetical protein ONS95_013581 [Cadophora gregata]
MGYTNEGNGPALLTACIVAIVLTWVFFGVRIYTRLFMTKIWKIEDWCFVATQASFTIYVIVALQSTLHGNGQRNKDIAQGDIPIAMQYFFAGELLYIITSFFMRLSIGIFILRIMTQKSYIWIIRATLILITLATVMNFFYTIFQCAPIKYFWLQFSGLKGKCLPAPQVQALSIAFSAVSAAADIIFGVLPIFVLWNLQMNRKAKIIVGALLCVGIVAGLTVIVRIKYIVDVSLTEDFMFATANVSLWAMIEPAIAICCMSASTWRPLFRSLREKTTVPSGGGYFHASSNNHTHRDTKLTSNFFSRSTKSGQNNTFPLSRSHNGYMRSIDDNDKETGSYDDSIALRSLEHGNGMSVVSGGGGDGDTFHHGNEDGGPKGILTSTTVEITRQYRGGERRGDDSV